MPFQSKRQQRAFFAGVIPGIDKEKALEWAHETKDIKKLPERAPAEKGKPTLRSKKGRKALEKAAELLAEAVKQAALGQVNSKSKSVGRFSGMQTPHALKAPGPASSVQAINPRRSLSTAINVFKTGL